MKTLKTTNINIENLKKAHKFMNSVDRKLFSMVQYRNVGSKTSHKCGTVGCIIGHCVYLTPMEVIDESYRFPKKSHNGGDIMFTKWSYDFFGLSEFDDLGENIWDYLFNHQWSYVSEFNTIRHAQYRIQRVIDGYVPESFGKELEKELKDLEAYNS
ncbi:hypothetical protein MA9V1_012 [Chryseobacterium phage MA9V-1]|nr:hypothetical protein MA9V1_012 [Chryseobacterium phage MA9V-1]